MSHSRKGSVGHSLNVNRATRSMDDDQDDDITRTRESKDVVTPLPVLGTHAARSGSSRLRKGSSSPSFGSLSRLKHSGSSRKIRPLNSDYLSPVARRQRSLFMLYPDDKLKTWWEVVIVIPVLYTVTAMPLNLFFIDSTSDAWWWTDLTVTILFAIDMLVQFNSAYFNNKQVLVVKRTTIAKHYLKTWFLVDLISLVPLDLIFSGADDSNRLLRLGRVPRSFRLLRLLRLAKFLKMDIISQLSAKIQSTFVLSKSVARFVKILLITLLSIHLLGGIWHFMAKENASDFTWLDHADMRDASVNKRYWASAYWAFASMTSTGYGDIVAQTSGEYAFSIVVMLIGIIGGALVVADILTIVSSLDRRSGIQKSRAAAVQQLIITTRPPGQLARELLTWSEHLNKEVTELSDIMPQLPLRLRRLVVRHVQQGTMRKFPVFKTLDDDKEDNDNDGDPTADLLWSCHRQTVAGESPLYVQGQPSAEMYFVIKGIVQVSVDNLVLDEMGEGSIVGAYDLLMSPNHTTSLDAITPCELLSLKRQQLVTLCRKYPSILRAFRDLGVGMHMSWGLDDDLSVMTEEGFEDDMAKHGLQLSAAALASVAVQRFKKRKSDGKRMWPGSRHGSRASIQMGDVASDSDSMDGGGGGAAAVSRGESASNVLLGLKPSSRAPVSAIPADQPVDTPPISAVPEDEVVGGSLSLSMPPSLPGTTNPPSTTTATTTRPTPNTPATPAESTRLFSSATSRVTPAGQKASAFWGSMARSSTGSGRPTSPNDNPDSKRADRRSGRLRLSTAASSRMASAAAAAAAAAARGDPPQRSTVSSSEAVSAARSRFRQMSVTNRMATDDLAQRMSAVEAALEQQARQARDQSEVLQSLHAMVGRLVEGGGVGVGVGGDSAATSTAPVSGSDASSSSATTTP